MVTSSMVPDGWNGTSQTVDLGGDIHYIDFGGPAASPGWPPVVLVHGLGGAYTNWGALGPRLAAHARVRALDLVGFGLSHPAGRSGSIHANAGVLAAFLREVVGEPVILVGNSMGGMISMIHAATHPDTVAGLVLLDPAIPRAASAPTDRQVAGAFIQYAIPGLGERLLARRRHAMTPADLVAQTQQLCSPEPDRIPPDIVAATVALVTARTDVPGIDRAYLQAARSLLRFGARRRSYYAMMRGLRMPVMLLHGEQDRLIPVESARAVAAICPPWCASASSTIARSACSDKTRKGTPG